MNLRKRRVSRAGGAEALRYEKNENHFAFAMAFAKLAEELAASEGVLVSAAGGTVPPAGPAAGGAPAPSGWIAPEETLLRRSLGRR